MYTLEWLFGLGNEVKCQKGRRKNRRIKMLEFDYAFMAAGSVKEK